MLLVIILYALFASVFTLSKGALHYTEPFFFIGSRMAFAGLLLLTVYLTRLGPWPRLNAKQVKLLSLLALLGAYITNVMEIWATKHVASSKVCLLYSLSPFISALLGYFVLKEHLKKRQWLGLAIGFIGLLPITLARGELEHHLGQIFVLSKPEGAMLIAVFCSVYGWVLLKQLVNEHNLSPVFVNGFTMCLGGVLALAHSYLSGEHWTPVPVTAWRPFLEFTASVCVISNLICYNLYGYLLKRFSATFMSFSGLVTPLFASLFGYVFLKESIGWTYFASVALFSVGLTLFYQEELGRTATTV